ncbi:concanavalin A-like lectin/glucanases superfamily protein [Terrimicrobium sacchariphilum]|uniref:Concanavalin A-like lectin/glucanases superfamily protein n=1 Tax=Terrimicrobium sacchariphilum TaxID=690879 RepID=A0A146G417_TERSA|nr:LamG-like jellyroll fold domain-containing protein [Terrimicrobium sacchariphilum]GAT32545.1 concanavalin A-like lectin/glucanases superfamily protein [Terrimicrobium sacchariphilum]
MIRKVTLLLIAALAALAGCSARAGALPLPSRSPESPVIFWAHYMPMVPHGHMHAHPYSGGNHDAWPFDAQHALLQEDYEEDIRQALDSGVNGFQMLIFVPEDIFEAARKVRKETGRMFYISPQWAYANPKTFEETEKRIVEFYEKHLDDPHVYTKDGYQIHFVWESARTSDVAALQKKLQDKGLKIVLAPTIRSLTSPDLDPARIAALGLRAAEGWMHGAPEGEEPRALTESLAGPTAGGFLYVPSIAAGYDSSNRPGQFIHVPFHGVRTLVDSLRTWVSLGYRQLMLVTWNDPQESLEIPSSRNIWGHNEILSFFHGVADDGKSPFADSKVVVSYPVECMAGDQFFFQVVGLPARGKTLEWRAQVALHPVGASDAQGAIVLRSMSEGAADRESLLEMRWDTSGVVGVVPAIQPIVSVDYRESGGEWQPLYQNVALPPTRLRFNLIQYPVPYAIDLARIAMEPKLALSVQPGGLLDTVALTIDGDASTIRKVNLTDGTRSLGAFREPEAAGNFPLRDIFVRIEASEDRPLTLAVEGGVIRDFYGVAGRPNDALKTVNAPSATFSIRPVNSEARSRVARLDLSPDARLTLNYVKGDPSQAVTANLDELRRGASRTVSIGGKPATLSMILTADMTDANIDYPVKTGPWQRTIPLHLEEDGPMLLQAMALLRNDRVAISPPVWVERPGADPLVAAQWLATEGTFEDFVNPSSETTLNPLSLDHVIAGFVPRSEIPWFHLDLEEGAGTRLNDRGISQQAGRASIETGGLKRDELFKPGIVGDWEWLESGHRGRALRLGGDSVIRFRSKSSPVGAQTTSLWVEVQASGRGEKSRWSTLKAGPFRLEILSGRESLLAFDRGGVKLERRVETAFLPGWNHLVFVYDLSSVRAYLNGADLGEVAAGKPAYQRTHIMPSIGFSGTSPDGPAFTGVLDDVQVIGAGLGPDGVAALAVSPDPNISNPKAP